MPTLDQRAETFVINANPVAAKLVQEMREALKKSIDREAKLAVFLLSFLQGWKMGAHSGDWYIQEARDLAKELGLEE